MPRTCAVVSVLARLSQMSWVYAFGCIALCTCDHAESCQFQVIIIETRLYSWNALSNGITALLAAAAGIQAVSLNHSRKICAFGKCSGHTVFESYKLPMMEAVLLLQTKARGIKAYAKPRMQKHTCAYLDCSAAPRHLLHRLCTLWWVSTTSNSFLQAGVNIVPVTGLHLQFRPWWSQMHIPSLSYNIGAKIIPVRNFLKPPQADF